MRRSILVAALLATTALTPARVKADPVSGFILGSLGFGTGAATALGVATGAGTAFAAGVNFAGTFVGGFIVRTVVAVGLSALAAKLQPQPKAPPPGDRMVNFAQPVSYAEYVYGRTRKGGPIGFTEFTDNRRYYVPILAAHPIEGIVEHWLDERSVTLTAESDYSQSNIATEPMAGYGRIDPFTGTEPANPGLVAAFTEITEAHDFKGLSGAVIWAKRPPEVSFTQIYPGGRQWVYAPVLDGKKDIFDPRDGVTKFTNNAALVIADWIVNILGEEVDWDEVAEEAAICDEIVINADGDEQPRWTLNGTLSDDQEYEDQRAQLAAACDAFFYERTDGKVGFTVGRWIEPTLVLGPDDFDAFEISEGQWGDGAPDEVAVTYTEPENAWRETPAGTWVENVTAKPVRENPHLYMISNHNQGSRVGKRIARMRRAEYNLRGTIGLAGYELQGGREGKAHRFFRFVHPEMGLDKTFELGELGRENFASFTLTATTAKAEDFDLDASEEPARPSYGVKVISDGSIPDPTGFGATALPQASVQFYWTEQDDAFTQEVRYRAVGETYWLKAQTSEPTDRIQVGGFEDGADIEAQIRNRTAGAGASEWYPETPITISTVVNP
ncbi:MAG: hypothetical protein KDK24_06135, partial [Pseudooceanicola sp.]|nr:hypothetical protein [Pseudooceanicola sp.]